MSFDLQMARGNIEGGWNLSVGEPVLLQKYLRFPPLTLPGGGYEYPSMEPAVALMAELRRMHPEGEIVVANGAKQAILAALYAFKKVDGATWAGHTAPFWPSFKTLSEMVGLRFNEGRAGASLVTLGTLINNPDGREETLSVDILDCVYAHWVYGWSGHQPGHQVSVHSASKLLGLPGLRVGWLVCKRPDIAQAAREFVELTTSGVCSAPQVIAASAIRHVTEEALFFERAYCDARRAMLRNGDAFVDILGPHCYQVRGVPRDGRGMFAWFQVPPAVNFAHAADQAKVALVTGEACGMEPDPRFGTSCWWRMNMCQDEGYTESALRAIRSFL